MSLHDAARDVAGDWLRDSPHPEPEALIAYAAGGLDDDAAEDVAWHLALCETCADVVLDAKRLPDLADELPLSGDALDAQWREFRAKASWSPTPFVPRGDEGPLRGLWRATPVPARFMQAALLALALGFGALLVAERTRDAGRTAPVIAHFSTDRVRDQAAAMVLEITSRTDDVQLIVSLPEGNWPEDGYAGSLVDAESGQTVWRDSNLARLPEGFLFVGLPPRNVANGTYRLEVRHGERTLGPWKLTVTRPSS